MRTDVLFTTFKLEEAKRFVIELMDKGITTWIDIKKVNVIKKDGSKHSKILYLVINN